MTIRICDFNLRDNPTDLPQHHSTLMIAVIYDKGTPRLFDLPLHMIDMRNNVGGHLHYGKLADVEGEPDIDILSFSGTSVGNTAMAVLEFFTKREIPFSFVMFLVNVRPVQNWAFRSDQPSGLPTIFSTHLDDMPYVPERYRFDKEQYVKEVELQRDDYYKYKDMVYKRLPPSFKKGVIYQERDSMTEHFFDEVINERR